MDDAFGKFGDENLAAVSAKGEVACLAKPRDRFVIGRVMGALTWVESVRANAPTRGEVDTNLVGAGFDAVGLDAAAVGAEAKAGIPLDAGGRPVASPTFELLAATLPSPILDVLGAGPAFARTVGFGPTSAAVEAADLGCEEVLEAVAGCGWEVAVWGVERTSASAEEAKRPPSGRVYFCLLLTGWLSGAGGAPTGPTSS